MAKKYFWLRLKEDFFTSRAMKKLRKIAGGDTYTIIYLKLQLLSLKDEGALYYEGVEANFYEEMALALDEDAENVQATLLFLESVGLISQKSEHEYLLTEVPYLIGGESESAERVRRHRNKKALLCNGSVTDSNKQVTKCNTEIDIEIDKDIDIDKEKDIEIEKSKSKREKKPAPPKHKYGEYNNVLLTDEEYTKLAAEYPDFLDKIENLSNYIASKGDKYKSHYATIRNWARKDAAPTKKKSAEAEKLDQFYNMVGNWAQDGEIIERGVIDV